MTQQIFLATAASVLLLPACANESPHMPAGRPAVDRLFEAYDRNDDGQISMQEQAAVRSAQFDWADTNGDSFIDALEMDALQDEFRSRAAGRRGGGRGSDGGRLARLGADGDGRLSEAEFERSRNPMLERADLNNDGSVTRTELDQVIAQFRATRDRR